MTDTLLASDLNQQVWEFLLSGGFFMWLIVLCSLVSAAIVFHRLMSLRREAVMPRGLLDKLQNSQDPLDKAGRESLRSEAVASDSALGEIAGAALNEDCESAAEAMGTTEAVAREEVLKLQSGLSILEDVITIAPLLGLLGTVSGLVSVFAELGISDSADPDPTVLAGGIALALNTTIAGLAVAVPTVVARTYFHKKIESMAVRMEILFGRLIHARYRSESDSEITEQSVPAAELETATAAAAETPVVTPAPSSSEKYQPRPPVEKIVAPVTTAPASFPPPPASPAALDELPAASPSPAQVQRAVVPGQSGAVPPQAQPRQQIPQQTTPPGSVGDGGTVPQPIPPGGGNPPKPLTEKPAK